MTEAKTSPPIQPPAGITVTDLEAGIDQIENWKTEIPNITQRMAGFSTQRNALEFSFDLDSKEDLAELVRLQTLSEMLPRRIEARKAAIQKATIALGDLCRRFTKEVLRPWVETLRQAAEQKIKKDVEHLDIGEHALANMLYHTQPIPSLNNHKNGLLSQDVPEGLETKHAARLIVCAKELETLAATI